MALRDVFCQDRAIGILQRSYALHRSAHAYIFAGLDGVGKYTTALAWSGLLLCESPRVKGNVAAPFADRCGSCASCRLFDAGSHPDYVHVYKELLEFTREGKGKKTPVDLSIDVIREFLIEQAPSRPTMAGRKVFVISEAEKLNPHSQNALLKVLEEPPHYCTMILLCTRLERLLPTVKSRCQIIRFGPVDQERIILRLLDMGLERKRAEFFARLAQGSIGTASQWAGLERNGVELFEIKQAVVASLANLTLVDALTVAGQMLEHARRVAAGWASLDKTVSKTDLNRRAQRTVIQVVISALHDVMTHGLLPERPPINSDQPRQIAALADRYDLERAACCIDDAYQMLHWIEANVNEKLIFERLLLRLVASGRMAVVC